MEERALERASAHAGDASNCLEAMRDAESFDELERLWSQFLIDVQRCFSKLAAGAKSGRSAAWFGGITHDRRSDPLIRYIHQARHADEHGIDRITNRTEAAVGIFQKNINKPATFSSLAIMPGVGVYAAGSNYSITFIPEEVRLSSVINSGNLYEPPSEHNGAPVEDPSLLGIAAATMAYVRRKIEEAAALTIQP